MTVHIWSEPDEEREIAYERDHDERYGEGAGPDPAKAAENQARIAAHYAEMMAQING